jgi:hypothetical protein
MKIKIAKVKIMKVKSMKVKTGKFKSVSKKTPLLQHAQTEEGAVELQTPAPASTLVFSHSLLPFAAVANRGQASKGTSPIPCFWSSLLSTDPHQSFHVLTLPPVIACGAGASLGVSV